MSSRVCIEGTSISTGGISWCISMIILLLVCLINLLFLFNFQAIRSISFSLLALIEKRRFKIGNSGIKSVACEFEKDDKTKMQWMAADEW